MHYATNFHNFQFSKVALFISSLCTFRCNKEHWGTKQLIRGFCNIIAPADIHRAVGFSHCTLPLYCLLNKTKDVFQTVSCQLNYVPSPSFTTPCTRVNQDERHDLGMSWLLFMFSICNAYLIFNSCIGLWWFLFKDPSRIPRYLDWNQMSYSKIPGKTFQSQIL